MLAIPAGATGDKGWHHHPIAAPDIFYRAADFHHLAHEFMTQDVALPHTRDKTVNHVQIGAAGGGKADTNDRVVGIDQAGIGHGFNA